MSQKGSRKSVPEHEKPPLPVIQIIDLTDSDNEDEIETLDKHRRKSHQKSSTSRINPFNTMCPYCTKTFSSEALGNHMEKTHANVRAHKAKKFSCPFSGCRKTRFIYLKKSKLTTNPAIKGNVQQPLLLHATA